MAISDIRAESETPNINNTDDIRALRYGFGGSDGYIKGYLNEFDIETTGYYIKSGEAVIQGWQVRSDSNYELPIASTSSLIYSYSTVLVLTIGASSVSAEIVTSHSIGGTSYPEVPENDDIGGNGNTGTLRILLYNYKSANGVITEYTKKITAIPYLKIETIDYSNDVAYNQDATPDTSSGNYVSIVKRGQLVNIAFDYELATPTAVSSSSITLFKIPDNLVNTSGYRGVGMIYGNYALSNKSGMYEVPAKVYLGTSGNVVISAKPLNKLNYYIVSSSDFIGVDSITEVDSNDVRHVFGTITYILN